MSFRWRSACRTHPGRMHGTNEDAYLDMNDVGLWLVADGMGGHSRGDMASRIVVETFRHLLRPASRDEFVMGVRHRLYEANRRLQDVAANSDVGQIIGSTVVALLVYQRYWVCLWAGDSRAYLLRDGRLLQITRDHSVAEELIERGELQRDMAAKHFAANRLTRAVGVQQELLLDEVSGELLDGDVIMLCSDGLVKAVSEAEIADVLTAYDCDESSLELVDLSRERGARDDVTVAVVNFEVTTGFGDADCDTTLVNTRANDGSVHAVPSHCLVTGASPSNAPERYY